jgi:hypothetical protein
MRKGINVKEKTTRGSQLAASFLLMVLMLFGAQPAWAHRPYFTRIEKIDVPACRKCELRLIHGDGIFFRDPVQAVLLDPEQRLIARSAATSTIFLYCRKPLDCLPYNADRVALLELDPANFIQNGLKVPGTSDADREDLWDLEPSFADKGAGFEERWPSLIGFFSIEFALWRSLSPAMLSILAAGGLVFASNLFFWRSPPPRNNGSASFIKGGSRLSWFLLLIPRIGVFLLLPLVASYMLLLFDGLSLVSWSTTIALGVFAALAIRLILTKRRKSVAAR